MNICPLIYFFVFIAVALILATLFDFYSAQKKSGKSVRGVLIAIICFVALIIFMVALGFYFDHKLQKDRDLRLAKDSDSFYSEYIKSFSNEIFMASRVYAPSHYSRSTTVEEIKQMYDFQKATFSTGYVGWVLYVGDEGTGWAFISNGNIQSSCPFISNNVPIMKYNN